MIRIENAEDSLLIVDVQSVLRVTMKEREMLRFSKKVGVANTPPNYALSALYGYVSHRSPNLFSPLM